MSTLEKYTRIMITAIWFAAGSLTFFGVVLSKICWNLKWSDFFTGMSVVILFIATSILTYKPLRDAV